jgi:hypothetical protein
MNAAERDAEIAKITALEIPSLGKGVEGIETLAEFLADVVVMQEAVISESLDMSKPANPLTREQWVKLHSQLSTMVYLAVSRMDWLLTEMRGDFHQSFRGGYPFNRAYYHPESVEDMR